MILLIMVVVFFALIKGATLFCVKENCWEFSTSPYKTGIGDKLHFCKKHKREAEDFKKSLKWG